MNERIEELAKECYVKTGSEHTDHFAYWKFAELIVKECANFADSHNEQKLHEDYNLGVGRAIKEHFGVKE